MPCFTVLTLRSEPRLVQSNLVTTVIGCRKRRSAKVRLECIGVVARYQRRKPVINEALKPVSLLVLSAGQTGHALARPVGEGVSALTQASGAQIQK